MRRKKRSGRRNGTPVNWKKRRNGVRTSVKNPSNEKEVRHNLKKTGGDIEKGSKIDETAIKRRRK